MNDDHYILFRGNDRSRRVYHGSMAAALRARDRHEDPAVHTAAMMIITDEARKAHDALHCSADQDMVELASETKAKHGWLRDYSLYAMLCGTVVEEFQSFLDNCVEDVEVASWGWRWEHVGTPDDLCIDKCDRIAEAIFAIPLAHTI